MLAFRKGLGRMPHSKLSNRHLDTLRRIGITPTAATIRWAEAVSLLEAIGCSVTGAKESRFRMLAPSGRKLVVHRPHPDDECSKILIARLRSFLEDWNG
ncbi:MAG: type II toxin-antitoxin system HicA family toxin [Trueperaceae bacterium]|nr:type II toxin-antitoxin system HicA family toxin [Trueperaceae bacterium]